MANGAEERKTNGNFLLRRTGDVIQGIVVVAVVGLVSIIWSLKSEVTSLKSEVRSLQGTFETVITRVTTGGYNRDQGLAVERRVEDLVRDQNKLEDRIDEFEDKPWLPGADKRLTLLEDQFLRIERKLDRIDNTLHDDRRNLHD